jgi:hypothetical protein
MPIDTRGTPAEVQAKLDELNPIIFGEGARLRLRYVRYAELREQDINANVMPVGMFNALVANVRRNAALESLPLCATREATPNVIEVVSGHHRTRAAVAAGLEYGVVLCYERLTDSEIKAKQLAHNAIQGTSDPDIVKEIFGRIESLDARIESYIDPELVTPPTDPVRFEQVDVDPLADAKTVTLVFLPTIARDFTRAMEVLKAEPDLVYVASREAFDGFREAVNRVRSDLEVLAYPTAVAELTRLAMERLVQLQQEREAEAPETERPLAASDLHAEAAQVL